MKKAWLRYFLGFSVLTILGGCGGGSSCDSASPTESASLTVTAPDQYPAGIPTTAYLTLTNNSTVAINNLIYDVPEATNHTSATIKVEPASALKCKNIAANDYCTLKVEIGANSKPGSFTVVASSSNQLNRTAVDKLKSLVGLGAEQFILTANIGLTEIPSNTQSGANGISFLVAPTVAAESDGSTQVSVVAVVNQNAGSDFNTINLTTQSGNLLDFAVLSGNSGANIPTNLKPGDIVTYILKIPAGASSPYSFYAQIASHGSVVNQGTVATNIIIADAKQGVLTVQPTEFALSAAVGYTKQVITYSNTGNGNINNLAIQTPQAPLTINKNNCNASLAAGRSCTVEVMSNAESGVNGNGTIVATYNSNLSVLSNYSYSGGTIQNGLQLTALNNFMFVATTGSGVATTKLTLQNNGNVNESNFAITFTPNQYFSLVHENGDSCVLSANTITNTLTSGQSCTITLKYNNSTFGVGLTTMNVAYSYGTNQSATTSQLLAYQTTQGGATLNITPTSYNYGAIVANSGESKLESFVATNAGVESISAINFQAMTGDSSYFSVESGGVGGCANALPLANGASCTFKVRFGPTATVNQLVTATLPVGYTFSSGSSSTSVALSGYSRTSLSANITLESVTATGETNGNGESANTAYQFESSSLNSATLVLTYKNIGATAAESFTISQAPSGYAINNNQCNSVTLQANAGNSCSVTLKPNQATAGALNVNLASSLLASWSDESSTVTNRSVLWDTGSGTQNTIYANVYASAVVNVVMSKDSAGLVSITNLKTNESFYIVMKLTGGYNFNTTYTVTAPAGFSPTTGNCNLTNSNPICSVEFTAPATASTESSITISGTPTANPASFTFDVVAPTWYAYVANGTPGVFQCTVAESDGSLSCLTPSTRPNATLDALSTIVDPTGDYLYVLTSDNTSPGSYVTCALGIDGTYDNTKCVTKTFPPYGNLAFAATEGSWFAYLAGMPINNSGNNPNYCTVFQESSLFCNVAGTTPTSTAKGVTSIVVNGSSLVYLSGTNNTDSPYNAKISVCDVTSSAGYGNCKAAYSQMSITNPTSLSAVQIGSDYYVYVLDYLTRVAYCKVETSGANKGKFVSCSYIEDVSQLDVSGVQSITAINLNGSPYLYASSPNMHTMYICPLNADGSVTDFACNTYTPDSTIIPSFVPYGVSFGSYYAN